MPKRSSKQTPTPQFLPASALQTPGISPAPKRRTARKLRSARRSSRLHGVVHVRSREGPEVLHEALAARGQASPRGDVLRAPIAQRGLLSKAGLETRSRSTVAAFVFCCVCCGWIYFKAFYYFPFMICLLLLLCFWVGGHVFGLIWGCVLFYLPPLPPRGCEGKPNKTIQRGHKR